MNTYTCNIQSHDKKQKKKIPNISLNIGFLQLSEEFSRESKTKSSMVSKHYENTPFQIY